MLLKAVTQSVIQLVSRRTRRILVSEQNLCQYKSWNPSLPSSLPPSLPPIRLLSRPSSPPSLWISRFLFQALFPKVSAAFERS